VIIFLTKISWVYMPLLYWICLPSREGALATSMISLACYYYAVLILKLSWASIRENKAHTSQREQVQLSLPAQSPINICCKYRTWVQLSCSGNNGSKRIYIFQRKNVINMDCCFFGYISYADLWSALDYRSSNVALHNKIQLSLKDYIHWSR
jgi:hypothetical protein